MFKEPLNMLLEFEKQMNSNIPSAPIVPDEAEVDLRYNLLLEELEEWKTAALIQRDKVAIADALADMMYILLGTIVRHGYASHSFFDKVFNVVHNANMEKFSSKAKFRADGKLLKPKGWIAPEEQILEILRTQLQERE